MTDTPCVPIQTFLLLSPTTLCCIPPSLDSKPPDNVPKILSFTWQYLELTSSRLTNRNQGKQTSCCFFVFFTNHANLSFAECLFNHHSDSVNFTITHTGWVWLFFNSIQSREKFCVSSLFLCWLVQKGMCLKLETCCDPSWSHRHHSLALQMSGQTLAPCASFQTTKEIAHSKVSFAL